MAASPSNNKVAVVTGSSSGIGYETALMLGRNGFLTYAIMRNLDKSDSVKLSAPKEMSKAINGHYLLRLINTQTKANHLATCVKHIYNYSSR